MARRQVLELSGAGFSVPTPRLKVSHLMLLIRLEPPTRLVKSQCQNADNLVPSGFRPSTSLSPYALSLSAAQPIRPKYARLSCGTWPPKL